ncbi:hypothetical protein [Streptomyces sp. MJP52]|uniref:hypothetical protein n=1 Tax=Streptomyces sp. MJP52 TaxID=2940555 RepID=UPI0024745FB0|nr:hypothetical protein [Streptomyces sp. MJP52]
MSHTARGILALVLSLPDGVRENVRTLSEKYPQGRAAVAKAVGELRALGYWVTRTERDPESGLIVSGVDVFEDPVAAAGAGAGAASVPVPTRPVTGGAAAGKAGTSPCGEKDWGKDGRKPSPAPRRKRVRERPEAACGGGGEGEKNEQESAREAEAARILRRLGAVDARLRLNERQVRKLVLAVCRWLGRGAGVVEVTDALTQGLPRKVYSAAHLVADRLERKLPERRRRWKTYAECGSPGCGNLLRDGQEAGICGECAVGAVELFTIDCEAGVVRGTAPVAVPDVGARVAEVRALVRGVRGGRRAYGV